MRNSKYKKPKILIKNLSESLKYLRSAFVKALDNDLDGTSEWIRDNYYLLEREGNSLTKDLKSIGILPHINEVPFIYTLCEKAVIFGEEFEETLRNELENSPVSTAELETIASMLKTAFIIQVTKGMKKGDSEGERLVGKGIKGIRAMQSFDADLLIEQYSPVDKILLKDPLNIYDKMDETTRALYRKACIKKAQKENINETAVAQNALDLALSAKNTRERHIGYYLLEKSREREGLKKRGSIFLSLRLLIPIIPAFITAILIGYWWLFLLFYFPFTEILRPITEYLAAKAVKANYLPRIHLDGEIPENHETLITVSALVPNTDKAADVAKSLEQIYLANCSGEIRCCLLADLKEWSSPTRPEDKLSIDALKREIEKLNRKYRDKFFLVVRKRVMLQTQKAFAGYERKRGAILELCALINDKGPELAAFIGDRNFLHRVKYLIALDSDTNLLFNAASVLVSAAMHPLNIPVIDEEKGCVTHGYGIIAPSVATDLKSARKTAFSRIMSGTGGITAYDTLSGDLYGDLFFEGIFAGKGLIHVDAFYKCMEQALPDGRVLSHDILETGFLRAAYMTDVEVTDGCPSSASSFLSRLHRWVRGDWQNILWLLANVPKKQGKGKNPLSPLPKYMLFDNLRRSFTPVAYLFCIILALFLPKATTFLIVFSFLGAMASGIFSCFFSTVSGGIQMLSRKYYSRTMPNALTALAQSAIAAVLIVETGFLSLDAISRALWRQFVSHKKLLEWVTAADSESNTFGFLGEIKRSIGSVILGVALCFPANSFARLAGLVLLCCPIIMYFTKQITPSKTQTLKESERQSLLSFSGRMWRYYDENCGLTDNFLPPDNIQESPISAVAHRTSPTNIGLMLLCTLAARDLGFIDTDKLIYKISRSLDSIEKLEKWNGNLLNWYDTKNLKPLFPRFVSSVDSGNFACFLVTLNEGLLEYQSENDEIRTIIERISKVLKGIDLKPFYNIRRKLFHIGYDMEENKLSNSFYDLLMSESRMTSYYAIATRQVPKKHYGALGRTLTRDGLFTGPVSWTGTMFEYFMPYLLLPAYDYSVGNEALKFCVYCQKKRGRERNAPWGTSESGFFAFDPQFNYQYKAHGVGRLGLKRRLNSEYVVSPYSTFLTLPIFPRSAFQNLKWMQKLGAFGRFGFYEAIDFTSSRVGSKGYAIVRSYMAHHVGMSIIAVSNLLFNQTFQKRFMANKEMMAAKELLQEKIPSSATVFKDVLEREVPEKPGRATSLIEDYDKISPLAPRAHILSNGQWTVHLSDSGTGFSNAYGVDITRRSEDILRRPNGVFAIVKAGETKFSLTYAPAYNPKVLYRAEFASTYASFFAKKDLLETGMQVVVHPTIPCEQRKFVIKNRSTKKVSADLLIYFEPTLSLFADDNAHSAFSKLFVIASFDSDLNVLYFTRRSKDNQSPLYLCIGFSDARSFTFECNRENVLTRPEGIASLIEAVDKPLSGASSIPDPCAAIKIEMQIGAKAQKTATILFTAAHSKEEALEQMLHCRTNWLFSASKAASSRIWDGGMEARLCALLLPSLLYKTKDQKKRLIRVRENTLDVKALWQTGISGDYPVVLMEIKNADDLAKSESYIRLHRRLFDYNTPFDLVLLYKEGGDYTRPIFDTVREFAQAAGSETLLMQKGGIHLVDRTSFSEEVINLLFVVARYIVPEVYNKPTMQVPPFVPITFLAVSRLQKEVAGEQVIGGTFLENEFKITDSPRLPWCHIIANEGFGTLVSDKALGFTWCHNAHQNKLTPWYNDTSSDNQGEMIIVRLGVKYFDLCNGAAVTYSDGKALYEGVFKNIEYQLTVTIEANEKHCELIFSNKGEESVRIETAYYTEPVLATGRHLSRYVVSKWENNTLFLGNTFGGIFGGTMSLGAEGGADTCICDRGAFLSGHFDEHTLAPLSDPCAAVIVKRECPPHDTSKIKFILGYQDDKTENSTPKTKNKIIINTKDQTLNHLFNTWLPIQIEQGRVFGRTGFYQCGGAFGFRDQLQDITAMVLFNKDYARKHILKAAAHQFIEGDVLHWWHELAEGDAGVRTRCSDDKLWLAFATCEYTARTNDFDILNEHVSFLEAPILSETEHERYFTPSISAEKATLYEHCLRAIDNVTFGKNGLPLMGNGDWNDGLSKIGADNKGESVWLAQFLSIVCEQFSEICTRRNDLDRANQLKDKSTHLIEVVDNTSFCDEWYLRAYYDNGCPLGAEGCPECEIDLLPQAFSVLSNMPDKQRRNSAINAAIAKLIDKEKGIIKLFTPPFDGHSDPGYIRGYQPGVRENGGQYTHAAVWLAQALFVENRADEGYELIKMLSPAFHSADPNYKLEPYYMAADIYTAKGAYGRGGWSIYTGAAGWYYKTILMSLLGIIPKNGFVELRPNLPKDFDGFSADMDYDGTSIKISVSKGSEDKLLIDGKEQNAVPLDGQFHQAVMTINTSK